MNIMDIVDIQHSIGKMISDLCLIRNTVCTASADGLNGLSEYLADNQLEYEKAIRTEVKDKGSDYFVGQLYRSLSSYLVWYAENNDVHSDNAAVSKRIYDRIVFLWIPPIENLFPGVIKTNENITIPACDNKDPKGYNSPYEQVGEHYRSIRYDIIENKDYPHLTNDEIYHRLKELAAPVSAEGVKIAMILNIAIKHRLLLKKPQGKSLVRELGMTCTNAAVINIIASPDEHFYIDEWGREMEAKLLKQ